LGVFRHARVEAPFRRRRRRRAGRGDVFALLLGRPRGRERGNPAARPLGRARDERRGSFLFPARRGRYDASRNPTTARAGGARTALSADLPPGGEVALPLAVTAPGAPGDYVLEIDMVHEGVTFFNEKGSKSLRLPVRVEP